MAESRAEEASSLMTLPIKALIPFMKALPLRRHLISVTSQRPHIPNIITLRGRISTYKSGRGHKYLVHNTVHYH